MLAREQGFSYLIALFLVAVVAIVSVRALENIATKERREKEAELLFVGNAYREAIRDYYENSPGSEKRFPVSFEKLLLDDDRGTKIRKPLRRLYRDPITTSMDWGVVEAEAGGIMGVYSKSELKPMKMDGFPVELASFTRALHYKDWHFVYQPK